MRIKSLLTLFGLCVALPVIAQPTHHGGTKKLIEFGWDEPNTAYLKAHIADMERMPFDGVVLDAEYTDPQNKIQNLSQDDFGKDEIPWNSLKTALNNLRQTRFKRFTDNFLRFNTIPGSIDWFDDFSPILHNAEIAARFCKQAHLKGILFDEEPYGFPIFNYSKQKYRDQHTFEQYEAQARLRGQEIMRAFQKGYPNLTIFLAFGYSAAGDPKYWQNAGYGLLPAFLDGIIQGAKGKTIIVDGYEMSYPGRTAADFNGYYENIKVRNRELCTNPEKYQKYVSAGFGIWMDLNWNHTGWHTNNLSLNARTPADLQETLVNALTCSDRYVWLYSEQPRWFPPTRLPNAYIDAVIAARKQEGMSNP